MRVVVGQRFPALMLAREGQWEVVYRMHNIPLVPASRKRQAFVKVGFADCIGGPLLKSAWRVGIARAA
jgi:hypothetical protein